MNEDLNENSTANTKNNIAEKSKNVPNQDVFAVQPVEQVEKSTLVKKKKGGKCLIFILIILIGLPLIGCGGGYFAYKRIVEAFVTEDFGIVYTEDDYRKSFENIGFQSDPTLLCIDCPNPVFSEPNQVSVLISDEQTSAVFEYVNQYSSSVRFSGTQIRVRDDKADMVTSVAFQGKSYPVTISGNVEKLTDNSISVEIYNLKVGALSLPGNINSLVQDGLQSIANSKLAGAGDNVRIDVLELTNDGVLFEGLVPTKASLNNLKF